MKVVSSAIQSVSYNPFFTTITFNHGKSYRYKRVGLKTFIKVWRAESVGRAYNELIKGKYEVA